MSVVEKEGRVTLTKSIRMYSKKNEGNLNKWNQVDVTLTNRY